MADITVTAANVLKGANAKTPKQHLAGVTILAGEVVYLLSGALALADANASASTSVVLGFALNGGSVGQPILVNWEDDDYTPGATLSLSVAGDSSVYVLSATPGKVAPMDDLAAAMYPVILFVAKTATKANLKIVRGSGLLVA